MASATREGRKRGCTDVTPALEGSSDHDHTARAEGASVLLAHPTRFLSLIGLIWGLTPANGIRTFTRLVDFAKISESRPGRGARRRALMSRLVAEPAKLASPRQHAVGARRRGGAGAAAMTRSPNATAETHQERSDPRGKGKGHDILVEGGTSGAHRPPGRHRRWEADSSTPHASRVGRQSCFSRPRCTGTSKGARGQATRRCAHREARLADAFAKCEADSSRSTMQD